MSELQNDIVQKKTIGTEETGSFRNAGNSVVLTDNRSNIVTQRKLIEAMKAGKPPIQKKANSTNNTGLPENLKSGIENLSGMSMDDVKVHYNSSQPAQLNAHAYAQGTDIHIAPGQEKHLPHEAWHVVQQKQGRVKPTMQMKGKVNINDDVSLEKEADVMGGKIMQLKATNNNILNSSSLIQTNIVQRVTNITHTAGFVDLNGKRLGVQTVGKAMTAQLDVADPVLGSATGPQWVWMKELRRHYPQAGVVRGHLLNHDLGGNGIPSNLYPISTKANAEHSARVEQPVKKILNDAADAVKAANGGNLVANDQSNYVHYTVQVGEAVANDPENASFLCSYWTGNGNRTNVRIDSSLGVDKDKYRASAGLMDGHGKVPPQRAWQHLGGYTERHQIDGAKVQQIPTGRSAGELNIPELSRGGGHDYELILRTAEGICQIYQVDYTNEFARYSLNSDLVKAFLLRNVAFCDDLVDFALSPMKREDCLILRTGLLDALRFASQNIPPEKLLQRYWTEEFLERVRRQRMEQSAAAAAVVNVDAAPPSDDKMKM